MNSGFRRGASACLLAIQLLALPQAAPASGVASHPPVPTVSQPPIVVGWLSRIALSRLGQWLGGQAMGLLVGEGADYVLDRTGIRNLVHDAIDDLLGLQRNRSIPPDVRDDLRRLEGEMRTYARILDQRSASDAQVRRQLLGLRRDLVSHIRQTEAHFAQIDRRITAIEVAQREQLKAIASLDGRVQHLNDRLVDAEGRITDLSCRMGRIEEAVFPDPDRFLRHEAYVSVGLLYADSPTLPNDASIGGEVVGQYNFNQYLGIYGRAAYMPLRASDVEGFEAGSHVEWSTAAFELGGVLSLLPPRSPISVQLGGGGGLGANSLTYYAPGEDRSAPDSGEELGSASSAFLSANASIGIAPPAFSLEPYASFTYMAFLEEIEYSDPEVQSNVGRSMWALTFGARFRAYLR